MPVTGSIRSNPNRKTERMGPYRYKTVHVNGGVFSSVRKQIERIQQVIDEHVTVGWELQEYHPVPTALVWQWNVLIFRKPRPKED